MTRDDAEYEFDELPIRERLPKQKRKRGDSEKSSRRKPRQKNGEGLSRPPREDVRNGMRFPRRERKEMRVLQEIERIKAPSKDIRYPDCPVSGKRSYGSPLAAADAMETIRKVKKGDHYPSRAYRCTDCGYWHMTSKDFHSTLTVDVVSVSARKPEKLHDPAELMSQPDHAGGSAA